MVKSRTKSKSARQQASPETPSLSPKEERAQKRKAALARKQATSFVVGTTFFCLVLGAICSFALNPKVGIGLAAAILCLTLSFKYPRQALYAFLIYLPLGGTITYTIGGNNPLFQIAKDAFYIPALIGLVQYCRQKGLPLMIPKAIGTPVGILFAYSLMVLLFVNGAQQFGGGKLPAGDQPFFMGLLGLKVLIGYIPLIPCAYYMLRDRKDLHTLMRLLAVLVLICCGLAFIQFMMLKTGRCKGTIAEGADLFKASLDSRCFVGGALLYNEEQGVIRLPGTFVAPWQWGWYLISSAFVSFAVAFMDPSFLWRNVGLGAMASTMILAIVSGQRIALALVPLSFIILLILTGQIANLKRFIPIGVGLGVILSGVAAANPAIVQERWDSFQARWNASPPDQFIAAQFQFVASMSSMLGDGLGRATNAARTFGQTRLIETYYPKLIYEIGPLGALIFLALVTTLTVVTFKAYRSLRDRSLRGYGAALWVFVLFISYNTYYYPLDVDPVAVYYWFFAGVIMKLPVLAKQEAALQAAVDEPPEKQKKRKAKKQGNFG